MILSQLMGTILKGLEPQQSQTLQLRPGQIVRAQILAMVSNEEALLQIGDLKVVGKLEASLNVGETAWLQVQNRTATGQFTLKAINTESTNIANNGSIEQLTAALGMKSNPTNHELVQTLVHQQVPLSKEKVKEIGELLNDIVPKGAKEPEAFHAFLRAIVLADKRNIPITEQTVKALTSFMSEDTLDIKIQSLVDEIDLAMERPNVPLAAQQRFVQLKNELIKLFVPIMTEEAAQTPIPAPTNAPIAPSIQDTVDLIPTPVNGEKSEKATTRQSNNVIDSSIEHTLDTVKTKDSANKETNNIQREPIRIQPDQTQPELKQISQNAKNIVETLKHMGLEHEHQLKQLARHQVDHQSISIKETVKNLLLSLQHNDHSAVSPTIMEAAEKVLNHITGQQLMALPTPQSDSIFSQLILQIPIEYQGQKSSASIQIEWKDKGGNGKNQVDMENCRIFFNLSMSNLGLTFVDVGIINRIINVKIFNDTSNVKDQFTPFISQLQEKVEALGYRFSGFSYSQIPTAQQHSSGPSYRASTYKGVDLRI